MEKLTTIFVIFVALSWKFCFGRLFFSELFNFFFLFSFIVCDVIYEMAPGVEKIFFEHMVIRFKFLILLVEMKFWNQREFYLFFSKVSSNKFFGTFNITTALTKWTDYSSRRNIITLQVTLYPNILRTAVIHCNFVTNMYMTNTKTRNLKNERKMCARERDWNKRKKEGKKIGASDKV